MSVVTFQLSPCGLFTALTYLDCFCFPWARWRFPSLPRCCSVPRRCKFSQGSGHCEGSVLNKNRPMRSTVRLTVSPLLGMRRTRCFELSAFHFMCSPQPCPTITRFGMWRVVRELVTAGGRLEHSETPWLGFQHCQGHKPSLSVTFIFLCLVG